MAKEATKKPAGATKPALKAVKEEREFACIYQAIAAIRKECEPVEKDGEVSFAGTRYKYASEAAMSAALRPLLDEHGLVLIPSLVLDPAPFVDASGVTNMVMEFTIAHVNGTVLDEKFRVFCQGLDRGKEGKWGDKGAYKANTGGWKYFLNRLFMVDTGDDPEREEKKKVAARGTRGRTTKRKTQRGATDDTVPEGTEPSPFRDRVWTMAWARAGEIGGDMSDEERTEVGKEIIGAAKAIFKVEEAANIALEAQDEFLILIAKATLDDDGRVVVSEAM